MDDHDCHDVWYRNVSMVTTVDPMDLDPGTASIGARMATLRVQRRQRLASAGAATRIQTKDLKNGANK